MINVTFTGNIYHYDGSPAMDVRYQGLFIKVNNNSSITTWNVSKISESNQYNINLGDSDWLSQLEGYASPNDKVLLCFWLNNTSDREDIDLTEWCFVEWFLDQRDVYIQDIQLRPASNPNCSFDIIPGGIGELTYIENVNSNDYHTWIYNNMNHYQSFEWDGSEIFNISKIPNNPVTIEWGDGVIEYNLPLSASPYPHQYSVTDDFDINVIINNNSNLQCSVNFSHRVLHNIYNGLNWNGMVVLNHPKQYNPNITGDINRITGVDYYIDGVLLYPDLLYNQSFNHVFVNGGNHVIRQCIKYYDGFESQIQCDDFNIQISTLPSFISEDNDCGLQFTDTSLVGSPPIKKYQWDVTQGLFILSHVEGPSYNRWFYNWPYRGVFQVRMAVTDSNDVVTSVTKEYVVEECKGGNSGSDGISGGSPWIFQENRSVREKPLPVVKLISIEKEENKKKPPLIVLIKEIFDF